MSNDMENYAHYTTVSFKDGTPVRNFGHSGTNKEAFENLFAKLKEVGFCYPIVLSIPPGVTAVGRQFTADHLWTSFAYRSLYCAVFQNDADAVRFKLLLDASECPTL